MPDFREWFKSSTKRRVTVEQIGEIIGVSRATATRYVAEGLSADHVIQLCRELDANAVEALVDLGHLDHAEVLDFLDGDTRTIAAADEGELALELARRLNPATKAPELDALEATADNWRDVLGLAARTPDKDDPRHE